MTGFVASKHAAMLVIFSVYRLAHDSVGVCVERPQHNANATQTYRSLQEAKSTLLSFGFAEEVLDECLKLVPQLEERERLKFPPLDVPHHDLIAAGFGTLELDVRP